MAATVPKITFNGGVQMPLVGLGTFLGGVNHNASETESNIKAFKQAIDLGYRHFDTAALYNTEDMLGAAIEAKIQDGTVKREELFITTKLTNAEMRPERVIPALKSSLKKLKLDYVDNYIVHWPMAMTPGSVWGEGHKFDDNLSLVDNWKAMEECKKLGLAKSIGISNYNRRQMQLILDNCSIKPANQQIEVSVFFQNRKLVEFCKKNDVAVVAYGPLCRPGTFKQVDIASNDVISSIGKKYNKSNQQIALKFLVQQGIPVIPKSANRKRQLDNLSLFDFKISGEDMKKLCELETGIRLNSVDEIFKGAKENPFIEEY